MLDVNMTNTIDNSVDLIANNPGLEEAARTREGYYCVCDLFEDFGWTLAEETSAGKTYRSARGHTKFLPYSWIKEQH